MVFQDAKRALNVIYGHSNSSIDEHRNTLHIMYRGSWDITSRPIIKTLHRAVVAASPAPRAVPHHKWMETSIDFDASDCPQEHGGRWVAPAGRLSDYRQYQTVPRLGMRQRCALSPG
jgi:hypothetical protein